MSDIIIKKNIDGDMSPLSNIDGDINSLSNLNGSITYGNGLSGTKDYNKLINKPQIESVELIGDKSFAELGLNAIDTIEILEILV